MNRWLIIAFRVTAVAEACSWLGLLLGMFFKYVVKAGELGVEVFGPIHGALFLAYVAAVLLVRRSYGWGVLVTAIAVIAAIPPFCSLIFERWASWRSARTRTTDPTPTAS